MPVIPNSTYMDDLSTFNFGIPYDHAHGDGQERYYQFLLPFLLFFCFVCNSQKVSYNKMSLR